jgi:hypothetical protein
MSKAAGLLAALSADCGLSQRFRLCSTGIEINVSQNVPLRAQIRGRSAHARAGVAGQAGDDILPEEECRGERRPPAAMAADVFYLF